MPQNQLPIRLGKEPLVDAIFELRFTSPFPASTVLPGLLLDLATDPVVQRLPAAQIPEAFRNSDPTLRAAPLLSLDLGGFSLLIGDESIAVSCKLPYPGWAAFKPTIVRVLKRISDAKIVQGVTRYSLKYVDIIPAETRAEQISSVKLNVSVGSHTLAGETFLLRLEIPRNDFINIVSIQSGVEMTLTQSGEKISGLLLDTDTVRIFESPAPSSLLNDISECLDDIHSENKRVFFDCMTDETINRLNPIYE